MTSQINDTGNFVPLPLSANTSTTYNNHSDTHIADQFLAALEVSTTQSNANSLTTSVSQSLKQYSDINSPKYIPFKQKQCSLPECNRDPNSCFYDHIGEQVYPDGLIIQLNISECSIIPEGYCSFKLQPCTSGSTCRFNNFPGLCVGRHFGENQFVKPVFIERAMLKNRYVKLSLLERAIGIQKFNQMNTFPVSYQTVQSNNRYYDFSNSNSPRDRSRSPLREMTYRQGSSSSSYRSHSNYNNRRSQSPSSYHSHSHSNYNHRRSRSPPSYHSQSHHRHHHHSSSSSSHTSKLSDQNLALTLLTIDPVIRDRVHQWRKLL